MVARIRALREAVGLTQVELAERAGVTRQLVGAVEAGRHAPNVEAAIGLARALGTTVEALFEDDGPRTVVPVMEPVGSEPTPVTTVQVGDHLVAVPLIHAAVATESWAAADALVQGDRAVPLPGAETAGLAVAGCDPVLGLAAQLVERRTPRRVVTVHASTGRSLDALRAGRVHGVVVHAPSGALPHPPVGVRRWHVARWQVGLASRRGRGATPALAELAERRSPVVQRDPGAGSQQALVRALDAVGGGALPGPVGEGHLDVARRVAAGSGRAGVTMEAAAHAFGLAFDPLEEHTVELWIDARWETSPAVEALVEVLASEGFVRRVAALGGYDLVDHGTER